MSHEDYEAGVRDGIAQERARVLPLISLLADYVIKLLIPSVKGESDE